MQFEVIKKSHKKEIIIGVIALVIIAIVFTVQLSYARYQTTKNVTIASGTINYKIPDFNIIAMYKNDGAGDIEISTMPTSGYTINESKSYCNLNGSKDNNARMYTDGNGQHVISMLSKGDRCYIYFDKKLCKGADCILSSIIVNEGTPDFSKSATTDEGVYKAIDESGKDSYYFRGAVENNYVKFANKFWRIIRINGDRSIRLIYDGETARANGTTLTLNTSKFNSTNNNNMHVGFKYTSGQVHGTGTKSTILENLETWYTSNLSSYASKLDTNAGFCGDRTPSTSSSTINNSGGTGTARTYYGGYIRLVTNKQPSLKCPAEDLYTTSGSIKGNKSLNNPIGLVTVDEVSMAGGLYKTSNQSYYLCSETIYWTMSPSEYDPVMGHPARLFYVGLSGDLSTADARWTPSVRPVINLRADITFTFNGTGEKGSMTNPYVVY